MTYRIIRHLFLFIPLCLQISLVYAQQYDREKAGAWADSVLSTMSPDKKIGQLFMVAAYSNRDSTHVKEIAELISGYHIGGLIFFQGGPVRQALLTNYYQSVSKVPLLVAIDGEWGLSMRLDSTIRFPRQMALGAIQDDSLIYTFGSELARQCKRMGIHINLAPVVDVNNNPLNPVINDRSFGEDMYNVAGKAIMYMTGMQDAGVLANAKHFPGHGNTDKDSHKTLPVVNQSPAGIDSLELFPFRELMKRGLASVMVAHLSVPALDSTENLATTLSKKVVTDLLKNRLHYDGLVFTDALNMKGVSAFYPPGVVDVKALLAGNDVLLFSENVPTAISEINKAIETGEISREEIDARVRKILVAKYRAGLNTYAPVDLLNLYEDLNTNEAKLLSSRLTERSLTLLRNKNNLVPIKELRNVKIAAVSIGAETGNEFLEMLKNYAAVQTTTVDKEFFSYDPDLLISKLDDFDVVIAGVHALTRSNGNKYGLTPQEVSFLNKLDERTKLITVVFGNPYALQNFDGLQGPVLMAYEDHEYSRSLAAQAIFGAVQAQGHLPVSASAIFKVKDGFVTESPYRLKFTVPEEVGMNSEALATIDSIALDAIEKGATPGCQVLVAKDGKVIYDKSFGTHTYGDTLEVKGTDLYDLASLTKILSTTLAVMKLYDEGRLEVTKKLSYYLPAAKGSNKKNLSIADILTHRAGLKNFIPFWKSSLGTNEFGAWNYSKDSSVVYSTRVAGRLFLRFDYHDRILKEILKSDLGTKEKYVYSDLGFYLMRELAERQLKTPLNKYVDSVFYRSLGLQTIGYLPRYRFPLSRIVPTEYDKEFRKQLVHGDVHDPGAAMMGGIAGHAGLFGNAKDVAIIMQMLLNKGEYDGVRYFKAETVEKFTAAPFPGNRRGLGFDKPETDKLREGPTCKSASPLTFGHTGFTGTCTWADPQYNLVYVFLSNRINPSADNKKLVDMNVRTKIQQVIYDAIMNDGKEE